MGVRVEGLRSEVAHPVRCSLSSGLSRKVLFLGGQTLAPDSTAGGYVCMCVGGVDIPPKGVQWSRDTVLGTYARVPDLQMDGY